MTRARREASSIEVIRGTGSAAWLLWVPKVTSVE